MFLLFSFGESCMYVHEPFYAFFGLCCLILADLLVFEFRIFELYWLFLYFILFYFILLLDKNFALFFWEKLFLCGCLLIFQICCWLGLLIFLIYFGFQVLKSMFACLFNFFKENFSLKWKVLTIKFFFTKHIILKKSKISNSKNNIYIWT